MSYSQRKVSDATTGAPTAQRASTSQSSPDTRHPGAQRAVQGVGQRGSGKDPGHVGQPARELGQRDQHAAQQQEHHEEAVDARPG